MRVLVSSSLVIITRLLLLHVPFVLDLMLSFRLIPYVMTTELKFPFSFLFLYPFQKIERNKERCWHEVSGGLSARAYRSKETPLLSHSRFYFSLYPFHELWLSGKKPINNLCFTSVVIINQL